LATSFTTVVLAQRAVLHSNDPPPYLAPSRCQPIHPLAPNLLQGSGWLSQGEADARFKRIRHAINEGTTKLAIPTYNSNGGVDAWLNVANAVVSDRVPLATLTSMAAAACGNEAALSQPVASLWDSD